MKPILDLENKRKMNTTTKDENVKGARGILSRNAMTKNKPNRATNKSFSSKKNLLIRNCIF